MNRITSAPISVLCYDVDKDLLLRSGIQQVVYLCIIFYSMHSFFALPG